MSDETSTEDAAKNPPAESQADQKVDLSLDLDPVAFEELLLKHAPEGSSEAKSEAGGSSSHKLSVSLSNISVADLKSKIGETDFLTAASASLTPESTSSPLQAQVHADLIKEQWAKIAGVQLTSTLGGDMKWTDGKGASGDVTFEQDVKIKNATIEGTITTDLSSGAPQVSAGLSVKFEF